MHNHLVNCANSNYIYINVNENFVKLCCKYPCFNCENNVNKCLSCRQDESLS